MSTELPSHSPESNSAWDQDSSRLVSSDEQQDPFTVPIYLYNRTDSTTAYAGEIRTTQVFSMSDYDDIIYTSDDEYEYHSDLDDSQEDMINFGNNFSAVPSSELYSTGSVLDADAGDPMHETAVVALPHYHSFFITSSGSGLDDPALRVAEILSANEGPKMQPATEESVKNLEKVKIDQESSDVVSCSVCLEPISAGSEAKRMPCSHVYHGNCIVEWLMNYSSTCPVCRYQMPVAAS